MYSILIFLLSVCSVLGIPKHKTDTDTFIQHGNPHRYIVGGITAMIGAHPHMAGISSGTYIRELFCGGSIVTSRSILTAAHCIVAAYEDGELDRSLRVTLGTNHWEEGGTMYRISHNVTHPNYLPADVKNDIGILVTSTQIVMTSLIRPILLDYSYVEEDIQVRVSGWGLTEAGGYLSSALLELTVKTISNERCATEIPEKARQFNMRALPVNPNIELCTIHSIAHGTCVHDSGSPLTRLDNGKQVGVVSWGFPCARGAPDVFARVSSFKDWLEDVIV